jgi:hypothetical protein
MRVRWLLSVSIISSSVSCLAESTPLIIHDVRVFDGTTALEHRSVIIQNGVIRKVERGAANIPNAQVIDAAGRTLLPGLIDAHVHLPDDARSAAQQALKFGITTQPDMFSAGDRLKQIKKIETEDAPDYSAVFTAGTGSHGRRRSSDTDGWTVDPDHRWGWRSAAVCRRKNRRRCRLHPYPRRCFI